MSLPYQAIAWGEYDQSVQRLRGLRIGLLLDAGCGLPVEPEVRAACARPPVRAGRRVSPCSPS
jgi:Asp-tRNA(Asn)/Glu-tRNA(Gln) amidotransferase A subunit family amidase